MAGAGEGSDMVLNSAAVLLSVSHSTVLSLKNCTASMCVCVYRHACLHKVTAVGDASFRKLLMLSVAV